MFRNCLKLKHFCLVYEKTRITGLREGTPERGRRFREMGSHGTRGSGSTGRLGASAGSAPCPPPFLPFATPSPPPFPCSAGFSKFPSGPMRGCGFSHQPIAGGAGQPPALRRAPRRSASALPLGGSGPLPGRAPAAPPLARRGAERNAADSCPPPAPAIASSKKVGRSNHAEIKTCPTPALASGRVIAKEAEEPC